MIDTKFSILIVDDEKSNLDILNHILKPEYTLLIAKSGRDALKRVEQSKPDLILLDIIMPDMSGYEVFTELKKSHVTEDIPVIFITGLNNSEDEEKAFLLGAVDYITKPFVHSIVLARVRTHAKIIQQMKTIEKLGMIDALTEIPNRRSFDNWINIEWLRAMREQQTLSLLMVDVDKFKNFNDKYGHPLGDSILKRIAKVITVTLSRATDSVARVGGEEFIVLLPNTDLHGALKIAEDIRANVESIKLDDIIKDEEASVTVSIGAASIIPEIDDSLYDFISRLDKALYSAKDAGRNKVMQ